MFYIISWNFSQNGLKQIWFHHWATDFALYLYPDWINIIHFWLQVQQKQSSTMYSVFSSHRGQVVPSTSNHCTLFLHCSDLLAHLSYSVPMWHCSTSAYLHQIWSVTMYYGTKRQPVPKGRCHVLYFHIVVMFTLYPTPLLESLERSHHTTVIEIQVSSSINSMFFCRRRNGRQQKVFSPVTNESSARFRWGGDSQATPDAALRYIH